MPGSGKVLWRTVMPRRDAGEQKSRRKSGWRWAVLAGAALAGSAAAPAAPVPVRADRDGEPLPAGALARLGTLRWRHGTNVSHVAFLPDGKAVLTASQDGIVRLWDRQTGKEVRRFGKPQPANPAGGAVVVPGGRVVAVGWSGPAFGGSFTVALAPDGKTLAIAGADSVLRLYEVDTGKELRTVKGPPMGLGALVFAPDGKMLAGRSMQQQETVYLWETATGKEIRQIRSQSKNPGGGVVFFGNAFGASGLAFAPDGKTLAVGETIFDGGKITTSVKLWETATGGEIRRIPVAQPTATGLTYSPDGKMLAYANGTRVHLCAADGGKEVRQLAGLDAAAMSLVFAPDGKTLAVKGSTGMQVLLYDPETGKLRRRLGEAAAANAMFFLGMGGPGRDLAFSPDGKQVAVGVGSTIRVWETGTGKEVGLDGGHRGSVTSVVIAPGGAVVASKGADNTIRLWEAASGKERSRFQVPEGTTCVALAPDGRLAALGNADGSVRLHETATGKELHRLKGHANGIAAIAFAPDGKSVASRGAADSTIRLYETASGKELRQIPIPLPQAPGGFGGAAVRLVVNPGSGMGALSLAFSPDGRILASPAFGNGPPLPGAGATASTTLNLWDVATGKEIRTIALKPQHGFANLVFSPDGRTLAAENPDQTVSLWESASGKERAHLGTAPVPGPGTAGPTMFVNVFGMMGGAADASTLAFAPDGRTLAAKGADGSVRLWDLPAAREIGPLKGHDGSVTALAFAPDGKTLASGGSDTTILLWDLAGLPRPPQPPAVALGAKEIESLWIDLAGDDARMALQGIRKMANAPRETVSWFRERLRPAAAVDAKKISQWVAGLDSEEFAVRQESAQELEKLGELAVPALQKLLANPPSLEARRRAEQILEKVTVPTLSTEQLRLMRALEVLEQVGSGEARQVLETLAKGAPGALATREAQAALDRLARRASAKPDCPTR
jgi:WD40 repeat protein